MSLALSPVRVFRAGLRKLERAIEASLAGQSSCCGVSPAQCHTLLELEGQGCVNLKGLAAAMGLDKSTLSRAVDTLVQQGLVDRSPDPADRRNSVICLSPKGLDKVACIHGTCDQYYESLLATLSPEDRAAVLRGIPALAAAMAAASPMPTTTEALNGCCPR